MRNCSLVTYHSYNCFNYQIQYTSIILCTKVLILPSQTHFLHFRIVTCYTIAASLEISTNFIWILRFSMYLHHVIKTYICIGS
jgi:uncharacterized Tic20 family protein